MIHSSTHAVPAMPKPILPSWALDQSTPKTLETASFTSGSALALLHIVLADSNINVPKGLLRSRLALRAAVHGNKLEGRIVTENDLRDAYYFTAPGDAMGPNGDMLAFWRSGSDLSLNNTGWQDRLAALLPTLMQEHVPDWFEAADDCLGSPVEKATLVLVQVMMAFSRQEAAALLCADIALARALGWDRPLPLLSQDLKRADIRTISDGADVRIACHHAIARATQDTIRLAHDLARRAARLRAIAPKLRSKGSEDAVRLFLSEDAVVISPMLTPTIRGS
ncbi:MAG: DUF1403 family protein, partial [bacterium]|nr:DUF1403 family protein [bacterium]